MSIEQAAAQHGFKVRANVVTADLSAVHEAVIKFFQQKGIERSASFLSQYVETKAFEKPLQDPIHQNAAKHIDTVEKALALVGEKIGKNWKAITSNKRLAEILSGARECVAKARGHLQAMLNSAVGVIKFHGAQVKNPKLLASYKEAYERASKAVHDVSARRMSLLDGIQFVFRTNAWLANQRKSAKLDFAQ